MLQSRLLGDIDRWTTTIMTWSRLQGELEHRSYPGHLLKSTTRKEVVQMRDEQPGADTKDKKRKRDVDSDEELREISEENAKKG